MGAGDDRYLPEEFEDAAHAIRSRKKRIIGGTTSGSHGAAIHPIYLDLKIHQFLSAFEKIPSLVTIENLLAFPSNGASVGPCVSYERLMDLVLSTLEADCVAMSKVHPTFMFHLMNCSPSVYGCFSIEICADSCSPHPARHFRPPLQRQTLKGYTKTETQFLWSLMTCVSYLEAGKGPLPFNLLDSEIESVKSLRDWLRSRKFSENLNEGKTRLYNCLLAFYMPKNSTRLSQLFESPLIAFLAMKCRIGSSSSYATLEDIPIFLNQIQFSLRLRIFHHAMHNLLNLLHVDSLTGPAVATEPQGDTAMVTKAEILWGDQEDSLCSADSDEDMDAASFSRDAEKSFPDELTSLPDDRWLE